MAFDEGGSQQEVRLSSLSSPIGILIKRINKMSNTKNPEISLELNETLNTFLNHLNETQEYLENGIFNVKFAEAGLFLQSAANLYSKKVDSLWDSTLQYQMQLCTYNKAASENVEEAEKLTQRLNRNKRKKIIVKDIDTDRTLYSDLDDKCSKASEFVKDQCTLAHTLHNQDSISLNNPNADIQSLSSIEDNQGSIGINGFRMPVDCAVRNRETTEKLCNYNDLYLNCSVPYLETTTVQNNKFQLVNPQIDLLLQKYLNMKQITYKEFWEHDHGRDFEIYKQFVVQRDEIDVDVETINSRSNNLFNITLGENNDLSINTQELLQTEKQLEVTGSIRKGSERISNADSLFPDEHYSTTDTETDHCDIAPYTATQRSGADSGICCSDIPNISSIMEGHDEHLEEHLETSGYHADESGVHVVNECTENMSTNENISTQVQNTERTEDNENGSGKVQNIQSPSITVMQKTNLSPLENVKVERLSLKRKLSKGEKEGEAKEKRKRGKRFKWLKSFTVGLRIFERFRKLHYQPEFGEGEISDISEDDLDDDDDNLNNRLQFTVLAERYEGFYVENYQLQSQGENNEVEEYIEIMAYTDENRSVEYNVGRNEMMEMSVTSENLNDLQDDASSRIMDNEEVSTMPEDNEEYLHNAVVDQSNAKECDTSVLNRTDVQENTEDSALNRTDVQEDSVVENSSRQCMPRIQNCESERVKVVAEWKRFIEPRLQQAEKNSQFDIHQYGTFIMDSIPLETNLAFKDIADGKPAPEVTRLFLAALQLANTNNVELIVPSQEALANDTLQMKLLTRERYHERLEDFEAPSENVFRSNLARMQASRSVPLYSTPKSKHKRQRVR